MTIVHIHRQRIAQNIRCAPADRQPPIIIRNNRERTYANELTIKGTVTIKYSPDKPLDCGARVWIEVDGEITNVA